MCVMYGMYVMCSQAMNGSIQHAHLDIIKGEIALCSMMNLLVDACVCVCHT